MYLCVHLLQYVFTTNRKSIPNGHRNACSFFKNACSFLKNTHSFFKNAWSFSKNGHPYHRNACHSSRTLTRSSRTLTCFARTLDVPWKHRRISLECLTVLSERLCVLHEREAFEKTLQCSLFGDLFISLIYNIHNFFWLFAQWRVNLEYKGIPFLRKKNYGQIESIDFSEFCMNLVYRRP